MVKKSRVSEFTSYNYIKKELEVLGWNTRNPERNVGGEVYTQQECLDNAEIKLYLNKLRPEYTIKVREDSFYIIEAKSTPEQVEDAYKQAMRYAQKINQSTLIKANFISGVAGNDEDGYIVKSAFLENGKYKTINYHGKELTSLISRSLSKEILEANTATIKELSISERRMLTVAEQINETLHAASINKDERASVMAAILLSMLDDTLPNYNASPFVFITDINNRARNVLKEYNKESFYSYLEITLSDGEDIQYKYKDALRKTMFLLMKINIKAAMNSGNDVLGKFYEVFLKYGNGAKDIGIVLTPRHITKFATSVLRISYNDIVYDPACGTGGFLVAAYDYVREHSTKKQVDAFKTYRIFGVEQQQRTALLAIVNMIFRGDGNNNIVSNNCLTQILKAHMENNESTAKYVSKNKHKLKKNERHPVTRVLMNPPFALKSKDEKEFKFIQHALQQMDDGGLLFAVVPVSVMTKSKECLSWRKELLANNTLQAVVTFPEDLFYPVGVNTCGIFIKKGYEHPDGKNVLWVKVISDGFLKSKGKRLPNKDIQDQLTQIAATVGQFVHDEETNITAVPQFIKSCAINRNDKDLELIPEAYLDTQLPDANTLNLNIEQQIREYVAYLIRNKREDVLYEVESN